MSKKLPLDQEYTSLGGKTIKTKFMSLKELSEAKKENQSIRESYLLELDRITRIESFYSRELGIAWTYYLIQITYEWELIFDKEIELRNTKVPTDKRPRFLRIPRKFLSKRRIGFVGNKLYTVIPLGKNNAKVICAEFK